jgi:hypothetical protein
MVRYSRGRNGWVKSECVYGWRRRGPLARGGKRSARASLPCATRAPTGIYVTCTNCPAAQYWIRRRERASAWRTQAGRATTCYIYTCRQKHWKQRVSLARVSVGQGEAPRFAIHVSCSHLARFLTNAAVHTTAEAMAPIQACRAAVREPQGGGRVSDISARPRWAANHAPTLLEQCAKETPRPRTARPLRLGMKEALAHRDACQLLRRRLQPCSVASL